MKNISAIIILLICGVSMPAEANESVSGYILKKQSQAQQTKLHSELRAKQWGSLNSARIVKITPRPTGEDQVAMKPPSPEELDMIETAAGQKKLDKTASKAAKIK